MTGGCIRPLLALRRNDQPIGITKFMTARCFILLFFLSSFETCRGQGCNQLWYIKSCPYETRVLASLIILRLVKRPCDVVSVAPGLFKAFPGQNLLNSWSDTLGISSFSTLLRIEAKRSRLRSPFHSSCSS